MRLKGPTERSAPVETEISYDLGPCCACERAGPTVRNVIMLNVRAPQPGTGWGCVSCRRPRDGALTVLCDECFGAGPGHPFAHEPRFAIAGFATESHTRVPIESLTEPFVHDEYLHAAYDEFCQFVEEYEEEADADHD